MAQPQYKLHYFTARGWGELPRLMFALADVEYEDKRYYISWPAGGATIVDEEFKDLKVSDTLPYSQIPICEVTQDGKTTTLAQCHAISRYIAREYGFFGKTHVEGALMDSVTEHIRDGLNAYHKANPCANPSEEKPKFFAEYMAHFGHLNRFIEQHSGSADKSTCVGSTISIADIYVWFYCTFFDDQAAVEKALESYPHVVAVRDAVANNPSIKQWLDIRPKTVW